MSDKPRLTWEKIKLMFHNPFRLSTGESTTRIAHWIRLAGDQGWGEGTIPPYYNIPEEEIISCWERAAVNENPYPDDPLDISAWVGFEGPAVARAALDLALHDRIGKIRGIPLYELLELNKPKPVPTAYTIAISSREDMARLALEYSDYSIIKLKLGSDDDIGRVAAVRNARPDAKIYLDANAAWSAAEAVLIIKELTPYQIDLIEQPVPGNDIDGLGFVQEHTNIPIVADESLRTSEDLEALAKAGVRGINLKIMKLGGLIPTLQILLRARELGLKVMLGCMAETSLGATAMAHLSSLGDWFDLDSPLLITNDPFIGVQYDSGQLRVPDLPGIGVTRNDLELDSP